MRHLNLTYSQNVEIQKNHPKKNLTSKNSAEKACRDYFDGFIYEDGKLKMFPHSEGYVEPDGNSYRHVFQYKDHLGNVRMTYSDLNKDGKIDPNTEILSQKNYYPFGLTHKGYNNVVNSNSNNVANRFQYNGKELEEDLGLGQYDFGARRFDPTIGRWGGIDALAGKYHEYSPYNYALNNPIFFIDPDGNEITTSRRQNDDGSETVIITVTGKVVNNSSTEYTQEQLQGFADRIATGFENAYSGEGEDISFEGVANISVAESEADLSETDHAIRIVDGGKIPDGKGGFANRDVAGAATEGQNVTYISEDILNRKVATSNKYAGTGKNGAGFTTLERTIAHELGHSAGLHVENGVFVGHPKEGTLNGNLMHQASQPNAGKKLTEQQILQIEKNFKDNKLNKGRQKIRNKKPIKK